jgi:hypothetical protein
MKKKTALLATEEDLLVDLTFHNVPASLISEFAEKTVRPYYNGNLTAAIQELLKKTHAEQDFVLSHIAGSEFCGGLAEMGKTVPSYRMALEEEIDKWVGFKKEFAVSRHQPFGKTSVYVKCIQNADVSKIAKLVKLVGMLLQTKVYLFWKKP